jgi:hypothetical protein
MPQAYWFPVKTTDICPRFPSGMTCEPLTADRGGGLPTWLLVASHARTSPAPERAQASRGRAAVSGWRWPGSFARWNPDTCSWRTRQCSLFEGLAESSVTWPRWGSMRDGECLEHTTLAPPTSETAPGSWPTIRSTDGERGGRGDLIQAVRGNANRHFATPTAKANQLSPSMMKHPGCRAMLPTPTAQDAKNNGAPSQGRSIPPPLNAQAGGPLNPTWVEWLMGWPIGWTDCEPLATGRFQQWLLLHGAR